MENLFIVLVLVSIVCFLLGLIRPTIFTRYTKKKFTRLELGFIFLVAAIVFFVLFGVTYDKNKLEQSGEIKETVEEGTTAIPTQTSVPTPTLTTIPTEKLTVKKIGCSYGQMMNYLSNFFTMEKSTPVDGEDRYMSTSSSGGAVLELIGEKDNLTSATLLIGVPNDNSQMLVENAAVMIRFLKNAVPETDLTEWFTSSMDKLIKNPENNIEKRMNSKIVTLSFLKSLAMISANVKGE